MNELWQSESENKPAPGRIMALDLGEKRIGVALSDETHTLARSFAVLKRTSRLADFEKIGRIIDEQGVALLVVGLPIQLDGVEGARATWVRDYATDLARHIPVAIEFWDESLSTVTAEASLRERGHSLKKKREWIDAVAAAVILQDYLDARRRQGQG